MTIDVTGRADGCGGCGGKPVRLDEAALCEQEPRQRAAQCGGTQRIRAGGEGQRLAQREVRDVRIAEVDQRAGGELVNLCGEVMGVRTVVGAGVTDGGTQSADRAGEELSEEVIAAGPVGTPAVSQGPAALVEGQRLDVGFVADEVIDVGQRAADGDRAGVLARVGKRLRLREEVPGVDVEGAGDAVQVADGHGVPAALL